MSAEQFRSDVPLRFRVLAGLIGIVIFASASAVLVSYGLGAYDGGYTLTATFDQSAQGLDTSSDVKVRGVTVGSVSSIHLTDNGRAEVTLALRSDARIADSAVASIEPLSVFGPKFVDIKPGAHEVAGPFLPAGASVSETVSGTDFIDVLSKTDKLLQKVDPADLAVVFKTFADSVAGLGPELGRLVDNSATLVGIGVKHLPEAQQFLHDLALLSGTLADHAAAITATVTNLDAALPAIATRADEIGSVLDGASQLAGSLSSYMEAHGEAFGQFIDSASVVLKVAYDRVPQFPDVFRLIDQFFGRIGDALRLPGPGGTIIAALHGGLYQNLCATVAVPVACDLVTG